MIISSHFVFFIIIWISLCMVPCFIFSHCSYILIKALHLWVLFRYIIPSRFVSWKLLLLFVRPNLSLIASVLKIVSVYIPFRNTNPIVNSCPRFALNVQLNENTLKTTCLR